MGNFDDEIKDKFSHLKEGEVILIENITIIFIRFIKIRLMTSFLLFSIKDFYFKIL